VLTHCRLLKAHIARLAGLQLPINVAQVREDTNFPELLAANPWMSQVPLVVKPDCLFGKRGKHDLVGLKLGAAEAQQFIAARMNKVLPTWGGC
jgi:ATP citrate (pro-S)-lyase